MGWRFSREAVCHCAVIGLVNCVVDRHNSRLQLGAPEGHRVIALSAERNMSPAALEQARIALGGESLA